MLEEQAGWNGPETRVLALWSPGQVPTSRRTAPSPSQPGGCGIGGALAGSALIYSLHIYGGQDSKERELNMFKPYFLLIKIKAKSASIIKKKDSDVSPQDLKKKH